ncbi:hypothetical protein ACU686_26400 [Yinghuangia aomiensis]
MHQRHVRSPLDVPLARGRRRPRPVPARPVPPARRPRRTGRHISGCAVPRRAAEPGRGDREYQVPSGRQAPARMAERAEHHAARGEEGRGTPAPRAGARHAPGLQPRGPRRAG